MCSAGVVITGNGGGQFENVGNGSFLNLDGVVHGVHFHDSVNKHLSLMHSQTDDIWHNKDNYTEGVG